ncbi:hypothetical protein RJT34_25258 [Clitoria ternatea]|uniref:Ubiquitin-like domain-containing protein n=1 Tax=Clitoria ternatea TaxID=43366 RepID=A0AAN9ILE4_CLITE
MEIIVDEVSSGLSYTVPIKRFDTVFDVKCKVSLKCPINITRHNLLFNGRILSNNEIIWVHPSLVNRSRFQLASSKPPQPQPAPQPSVPSSPEIQELPALPTATEAKAVLDEVLLSSAPPQAQPAPQPSVPSSPEIQELPALPTATKAKAVQDEVLFSSAPPQAQPAPQPSVPSSPETQETQELPALPTATEAKAVLDEVLLSSAPPQAQPAPQPSVPSSPEVQELLALPIATEAKAMLDEFLLSCPEADKLIQELSEFLQSPPPPPEGEKVTSKGTELEDSVLMWSPRRITLRVKVPKVDHRIGVEVDVRDTVRKLKEKILERVEMKGVKPENIVLQMDAEFLENDNELLQDCGVNSDCAKIDVVIENLKVKVLPMRTDEVIETDVYDEDKVEVLRRKLEVWRMALEFPLPRDGGYFFIHKQRVMEENMSFKWHNVQQGDTIDTFDGYVTGEKPTC